MKKIVLVIVCLLLCGCYDYKELNQIAIIGGIGIDYEEDEYKISLEVINDKKQGEQGGSKTETIIVTGEDEVFIDAMLGALRKIDRDPYFHQTQLLILGEGMAEEGVAEIFDFLLRDSKISNSFYTVLSRNKTPEEVMKATSEMEPIASSRIIKLIEDGTTFAQFDDNDEFDLLVGTYLKPGIDMALNAVEIVDQDLVVKSVGVFSDDKLSGYLSLDESLAYSEMKKPSTAIFLTAEGDTVETHNNKSGIEYKDGKILVSYQADATIKELKQDLDLKSGEAYKVLSEQFSKDFQEDIEKMIRDSREFKGDVLGFGNTIYKNAKDEYRDGIGLVVEYEVNVDINVNKNGLLFEVVE